MEDSISFSLRDLIVLKRFEQSVVECVSLKGHHNYLDSTKRTSQFSPMKQALLTSSLILLLSLICNSNSSAQVSAGNYSCVALGTAGSHASEPGTKGTMTVSSRGAISGTAYSYADGSTTRFSGTVNLTTGVGTITTQDGTSYKITAKTSSKTFLDCSYTKINSSSGSKGILWGIR